MTTDGPEGSRSSLHLGSEPSGRGTEPGRTSALCSLGISARIMAKTFTGESEQIDIMVHPLAQTLRMHSHVRIPMAIGETR